MARARGGRAPAEPLLSLALWVAGALLSAATVWWGLGPHDEGLMLAAAERIADGQWPYRDFWWNYGPGQPLLLAPFDGSLIAWRVIRVLADATVALLAFHLARRFRPEGAASGGPAGSLRAEWPSLLAWLAVATSMAWPSGPGPNPTALALAFGALLLARKRPALAGGLAGLAVVFRPEIGVAAAIGVALEADGAARARALAVAAGVAVVGWLPFFVADPGELLDQTVGFLAIQDLQRLPFPLDPSDAGLDPNKLLELYAPLILVAGTVLAAFVRPPLALVPLAVVGLLYLLGRTDEFHLVPLAAVLPIILVSAKRARAAALVIVALIALHGLDRIATLDRDDPAWDAREGEVGRVLDVVDGRSLFVAPPRFDQVTVGNPLLYVLADQRNPTRYDVMQPGVVTTAKVQREMVADLERTKPEVLIRWTDPRTRPEDNASGRSSGVGILDAYLRARYRLQSRIGFYEVHERAGG